MSVEQEGDVESSAHEEKPVTSDNSYESICRRIVGKCSFLLLAVQPAVRGENTLHVHCNVIITLMLGVKRTERYNVIMKWAL